MSAKTLSVLGHHRVSAENAGKIIDELSLPEGSTDEETAAALDWVIENGLNGKVCRLNPYHELESILRVLKLMLSLTGEDLSFFLGVHGLTPLPEVESTETEKIQGLILSILEKQGAVVLIRDAFPLD